MGKLQKNNSVPSNSLNKLVQNFVGVFKDEFFWFTDNSGKTYFSENLLNVTGYLTDEITSLQEIIYKEDIINYKRTINALENNLSKDETSCEYRIVNKNSKIIWVCINLKVFRNEKGNINRSVGRVIDISERKTREIKLEDENENLKSSK